MLSKLVKWALSNRLVVLLLAALLTGVGAYITKTIQVDVFPDLTAPTVTILTEAHGMESEEVEKFVTYPLEAAMNGAPKVRRIRSSSAAGISIVWVEFEWGMDIYRARQVTSERLAQVEEQLPKDIGRPTLAPVSSIMGEVMLLALESDSLSPIELRTLADWMVRPRIKTVQGISNVIVLGGAYKQYQVLVHPDKLAYYKLSIDEVYAKVQAANKNTTGGVLNQHSKQYLIKGYGRAYSIDALERALVKQVNGQSIRLKDIATVTIGAADKIGDASLNAKSAVLFTLSKQPGVNTLALTERLEQTLSALQAELPNHVVLHKNVFRQADFIASSISNLQQTLLEGALFVCIVLFLFLMNWRTTFISLLTIPVSLIAAVLVLNQLGYTLNTMSLGGMAIAIGALVDDAIIDVENVFKRLRENAQCPAEERLPILQVIYNASLEIRSSIIVATLIIVVSFVPLFFLSGMEGRLLKPLGIAFIVSVLASLAVAVSLTPVLCAYLLQKPKVLLRQAKGTYLERFTQKVYVATLTPILKKPILVIALTLIAFIGSLSLATSLGRSFLPEFNEGAMVISAVTQPGTSLEESNRLGRYIETRLLELPEVRIVSRRTGRAELDEHAQGVHASELDVPFALKDKTREAFFVEVRAKLADIPGVNITIGQPLAHRIDHMLSGTRANIAIKIFGPDLTTLFNLGKQIEQTIDGTPGLVDLAVEQQVEVPQLRVNPNRERLAVYGLTVKDLLTQLDIAWAGEVAGQIYEGQRYFDIVVRLDEVHRTSREHLPNTQIALPNGTYIPLEEVAQVESVGSPNRISREDVARKVVVSANVQNRDLTSVVEDIKAAISAKVPMPEGYRVHLGGQFENAARASQLLGITAVLAILAIWGLLYYEFKNLSLASIVLANLPLALIGGILAVFWTSEIINIASIIGFISLFGIATRNGILLISRYEDLRQQGAAPARLLLDGALDRLNPILMTTCTTGLALIPLALKGGEAGNEIQSPMAIVILGGLCTATLLNLFVIPCIYQLYLKKVSK